MVSEALPWLVGFVAALSAVAIVLLTASASGRKKDPMDAEDDR